MSKRIIPVGYDEQTGEFVVYENGDELTPVPIDLFGNIQVAQPQTLFSSKHRLYLDPRWHSTITGGGTVTHTPHQSAATLAVTTASGDKVVWQTKNYIPYQPGKVQGMETTSVLTGFDTNRRFRYGQFDDQNGIYIEYTGATPTITLYVRDYVQGSVRNVNIDRVDWNIDKLDGSGPSGITLDPTKIQIFMIQYQWLAAGTVEYAFDIDGVKYPIHRQHHANDLSRVYMSTATLPIRFEIENTGTTSSTGSIVQICTEVHSKGGQSLLEAEGIPFTISNVVNGSVTGKALGNNNQTVVLAIRMKTTLGGVRNTTIIQALTPWFNSIARNIWIGLLRSSAEDPSTETGGTWTSVSNISGVEYNLGITALTPSSTSHLIYQNSVDSSSVLSESRELLEAIPLFLDVAGSASSTVYMLAQRLEANNTTVFGGFNWKEIK